MTNREYLISVLNMTNQLAYCNDFRGLPVKDPSAENCSICKKLWLGLERTKE